MSGLKGEKMAEKVKHYIPEILPIMPLRNSVLFPHQVMPITVGRESSLKLVQDSVAGDRIIGIVPQKDATVDIPKKDDLYNWGTAATILKIFDLPDGSKNVVVQGLYRVRVITHIQSEPFIRAAVEKVEDAPGDDIRSSALASNIHNLFMKVVELSPYLTPEHAAMLSNIQDPGRLVDTVFSLLNISTAEKEEILETASIKDRLEKATVILNKLIQTLELSNKIQSEVQGEINKNQREYYLREQMKAIQKELGELSDQAGEIKELKEKVEKSGMPEEVAKVAYKEIDRLSKMSSASAEYTVSRTYIDWLLDMPWNIGTEDNMNIDGAQNVLENDHYGLPKVKKRILEYLAVRKLKSDMRGPILCFVGPPGVGKTSLGRSIAGALGRKFIRISLGGIRDEAEIRGHRRTYIGALPGRIIQGIKKANSKNPVFMLDEIDKVGTDFRGDPSSALLEVLDPEQNFSFSDHYLEVPFDVSKVMFITTANLTDPIPPALKDRMEIIEIPGYTEEEKLHIAQKFLFPKQLKEHGLTTDNLELPDKTVRIIINSYTREAGVRNLEREIATICRGVAKDVAQGKTEKTVVMPEDIYKYLGSIKFFSEVAERITKPGIATGVAWTQAGGDILFVEATKMRGKGNLALTGQLGDIMKESAQAAFSYIRSQAKELGIEEDFYEKFDLHIHVPAGAIPKDGPSAGVTMLTAMASLLTGKIVRNDVAMTGEITLRGAVLPVGGIKEKVLAAHRAGIKIMLLPDKNEKDLDEVPAQVREELKFHFVKEMNEILNLAITN
jgi:ATP-dependent Lon protease